LSPEWIDYDKAKFWLNLAQWVFMGAMGVWVYLRTKDNDNAKAVKAVADELAEFIKLSGVSNARQNDRITVLEESVKHMPTDQEVQQIANDVSSMKSRLEGQSQLLSRVERQTNLIHEHLLKQR
jgi:hypothetical protein